MAQNIYCSFKELAKHETIGLDFQIYVRDVGSAVTIIAPHGGRIEPNTSEIARLIAEDDYNCYCFEGIKKRKNSRLHITSHLFDEPSALKLISRSDIVISVHACTGTAGLVYLGGRDTTLKKTIGAELINIGISTSDQNLPFKGVNPLNICNCGRMGQGVQLEITRDLRDDPSRRKLIAKAVRASLPGCYSA